MPEKRTTQRARRKLREGKHGARSARQAIAIGLSKARRAGVPLPRKKGIKVPKRSAHTSSTRARASLRRLKREPRRSASHRAARTRRRT